MNKPEFYWQPESGVATCILRENKTNKLFIGEAFCHEEDREFMSEKTGCTIAERRAELSYLRHIRDNVLIPEIKALKHFYSIINQSKKSNPNGYEQKMLKRQIENKEMELGAVREMIKSANKGLIEYLEAKEQLRTSLKKMRGQK